MIFKINRASDRYNEKPCEGAFHLKATDAHWSINISTLEELMDLIAKVNNSLIIDGVQIDIYDDYME